MKNRLTHLIPSSNRMAWLEMAGKNQQMESSGSDRHNSQEARCSLCGHPFLRCESKTFPFCSSRCQQIDLGQWLDEKLGLPFEGQEEQEFSGFPDDEE